MPTPHKFIPFVQDKKVKYSANATVFTVDTQYGYTHQFSVTGTNISIDWGDGTTEEINSASNITCSHTYLSVQRYTIKIANCTNFRHSDTNNIVVSAEQLGDTVTNLTQAFYYCIYLNEINFIVTNRVTTLSQAFRGCSTLNSVNSSDWDVSNCSSWSYTFYYCSSLTTLDTSNWDLSNCSSLSYTFQGCSSLISLNSSNWDLSSCTLLAGTFTSCAALISLDTSNWNLSNCSYCSSLFNMCSSLTSVDTSHWDLSSCKILYRLMRGCSSLTSVDTSNWDLSSCTSLAECFQNCSSLEYLDTTTWTLSSCVTLQSAFSGCNNLATDITNMLNSLSTNSINISSAFNKCSYITGTVYADKLWNNEDITFTYDAYVFNNCASLNNYNEIPSLWGGGMI